MKIKKQAFSVLSEKILYKSHETVHLLFRGFLDLGNYIENSQGGVQDVRVCAQTEKHLK